MTQHIRFQNDCLLQNHRIKKTQGLWEKWAEDHNTQNLYQQ